MKKSFKMWLCSLALLSLFAACSDKDDNKGNGGANGGSAAGDVQMLSFGFYAEDNNFNGDYTALSITGTEIKVAMPDNINKSRLVARFTAADGSTVTVNGVAQSSGVSANDFSIPVDYLVSNGSTNAMYTVRITKMPSWEAYSTCPEATANDIVLRLHPETGAPYAAFITAASSTDARRACVVKCEDGAWSYVGSESGISEGRPANIAFNFDMENNMYLAYTDYAAPTAQTMSVQMSSGSTWSYVGEQGFTSTKAQYIGLGAITPSDIIVTYSSSSKGEEFYQRTAYSSFNGSTWSAGAVPPGRTDNPGWYPCVKRYGDALYIAVFEMITNGAPSMYKYQNKGWTTLGEVIRSADAVTGYRSGEVHFDLDSDGNIYMLMADDGPVGDGVYKVCVQKYDAATGTWSRMGNYLNTGYAAAKVPGSMDIGVDPFGTPVVVFKDPNNCPAVITFDNETKDWSEPVVLGGDSGIGNVSIAFSQTGGYILYTDTNKNLKLFSYGIAE